MTTLPLLFVHGFKGATLIDTSTNSLEWLTAAKALGLGRPPRIALPLEWDATGTRQASDSVRPGEPIWRVSGIYSVYAPLLAWGKRRGGLAAFCYDWRRDLFEAADALLATLRSLPAPPQVVAHSMGGLVASAALARAGSAAEAERLVHSVVFAGTPFLPSTAFLEDMTPGAPLHLAYLDSPTTFTFPSVLSLFPVEGDLGDAQMWVDRRLGLFSMAPEPSSPERLLHLRNGLGCGRRFRDLLATPLQQRIAVPVAVLASSVHPTPSGPDIRTPPRSVAEWRAVPKEPGDGRVGFESATHLPPFFASEPRMYTTHKTHGDLLSDTALVEKVLLELAAQRQ